MIAAPPEPITIRVNAVAAPRVAADSPAVDRCNIERREIECLGYHLDRLLHPVGIDSAQTLTPHPIGDDRVLDHQLEARALHLLVDQRLTLLYRGDGEARIGDCRLECFGNAL